MAHVFALMQAALPKKQRIPHVLIDFPWNPPSGGFRLILKRMQFRLESRAINRIVVHGGPEEQSTFATALRMPPDKFIFVPYHTTKFSHPVSRGDYIFAGGDSFRDYRPLIEAMKTLPYRVIIATNRKELIQQSTAPKNVEFVRVGAKDFDKLIAESRIVVIPVIAGLVHGAGQSVLLNSLAYGKPVIMTDDGHARNYVTDGETALLVPSQNPGALRQAIQRLFEDERLADNISSNALAASVNHTPERFFERVFALIDDCRNQESS
ncbi:MAG TPA: glycosyltransferase [Bryobacteraceae bacterium]|nr:glycosyltransferase [Bryobacteraceae bacterium]